MLTWSCRVWLFVTLWTVACQAPLSVGLSRQEYWGGLSCPPPGDLPDPGIKTASSATPTLQADSTLLSHRGSPIRITTLPQNISSLGHSPKYIHTYIHIYIYIYVYVWYFCYCLATKLCLTLRNPMDCSLPGSFVFGISQARILEGAASSFSSESSRLWVRTWVTFIGREILYHWATREAHA